MKLLIATLVGVSGQVLFGILMVSQQKRFVSAAKKAMRDHDPSAVMRTAPQGVAVAIMPLFFSHLLAVLCAVYLYNL